jgi:hypothetical protein
MHIAARRNMHLVCMLLFGLQGRLLLGLLVGAVCHQHQPYVMCKETSLLGGLLTWRWLACVPLFACMLLLSHYYPCSCSW